MSAPPPPLERSGTASFLGRPLRLGILTADRKAPAWTFDVINLVQRHPGLETKLILGDSLVLNNPVPGKSLLHRLFNRVDARRTVAHESIEGHPGLEDRLLGLPTTSLGDFAPDVVWLIGDSPPSDVLISQVPYGVWRYQLGDGFREVYERANESVTTLSAARPDEHGFCTLGTAHVRTHSSSPAINAAQMAQAGTRLLLDALDRLLAHTWSPRDFFARHPCALPGLPEPFTPSNLEMMKFAAGALLPSFVRTRLSSGTRWQWTVGIAPVAQADLSGLVRANEAQWMSPPGDGFLADPFAWHHDGDWFVFVEEFSFASGKGHISVARWNEEAGFGPLETALVEDFHLSYPFLFEYEGQLFMLPEQQMGGGLWAYRCVEFPQMWIRDRLVLEGVSCVDGTLLNSEGRWWLFYSRVTGEMSEDNLYACHAPTPFGPWVPHPMNPLRSGLRGSRMAGGFFRQTDGRLIRPAQDCSVCYGGSLVFFEVEDLSPKNYREQEIAVTDAQSFPAPWNERCHTFNLVENHVVFDACRRIVRQKP